MVHLLKSPKAFVEITSDDTVSLNGPGNSGRKFLPVVLFTCHGSTSDKTFGREMGASSSASESTFGREIGASSSEREGTLPESGIQLLNVILAIHVFPL